MFFNAALQPRGTMFCGSLSPADPRDGLQRAALRAAVGLMQWKKGSGV